MRYPPVAAAGGARLTSAPEGAGGVRRTTDAVRQTRRTSRRTASLPSTSLRLPRVLKGERAAVPQSACCVRCKRDTGLRERVSRFCWAFRALRPNRLDDIVGNAAED